MKEFIEHFKRFLVLMIKSYLIVITMFYVLDLIGIKNKLLMSIISIVVYAVVVICIEEYRYRKFKNGKGT